MMMIIHDCAGFRGTILMAFVRAFFSQAGSSMSLFSVGAPSPQFYHSVYFKYYTGPYSLSCHSRAYPLYFYPTGLAWRGSKRGGGEIIFIHPFLQGQGGF